MALGIASFMNDQQTLFVQTRRRLAFWYAGVMGLILGISGFGVYEAIDHAHRVAADRELQSVAGQIHDSIEPLLKTSAVSRDVLDRLPNACVIDQCSQHTSLGQSSDNTFQGSYYIRLVQSTGEPVVLAGLKPSGLPIENPTATWQVLRDSQRHRYRQISLPLQYSPEAQWGYLQVGSSLQASDEYLVSVRWAFGIGLPLALACVAYASWWLSGRAMRPIYESYQNMQQFTADAAHELRTPLAAAQATVESVLEQPQESIQETLLVLDRQHRRLSTLIQDLLLLTRLDRQVEKKFSPCSLTDIVNDVAEELAALSISYQLKFQLQVEAQKAVIIYGNEEQLYRLVSNLVMNAFQYTPAGGQVTVILKAKDDKATVQVMDTGIGIDLVWQKKIFDRFVRVKGDRARSSGGSGLGLSIAQAIATQHKGQIQVMSEVGKGSTFSLSLPLQKQTD